MDHAVIPAPARFEAGEEIQVPCARILDAPGYAWRGLSLDVARTFFTVEEIRRVIDLLELYKLNVLRLHLTDDQAWRLALGHRPPARSPSTATRTSPDWLPTPRIASSRSSPRSTRLWAQDGLTYFRAATVDWV